MSTTKSTKSVTVKCTKTATSIPSKIETTQGTIDVALVDSLEHKKEAHGLWEWNKQKISIEAKLCHTSMQQCLLHELMHVIEDNAGQKFTEQQIDALATQVLYTLKHNKKLVDWLQL